MFSSLRELHLLRAAASAGLKGALPKVLLGAALLGGGGSVLFAGSAQAAITCTPTSCNGLVSDWLALPGNKAITVGDKTFSDPVFAEVTAATLAAFPNPPSQLVLNGPFYQAGDTVNFDKLSETDYAFSYGVNPTYNGVLPQPFTLSYKVTTAGANIIAVDLDSNVPGFTPPSEVFTATYNTTTLVSNNGATVVAALIPPSTVVNVSNVYNGGPNWQISGFENSFRQESVPGPIPLLGAGMAFGFSRKLRSRIKARVQA